MSINTKENLVKQSDVEKSKEILLNGELNIFKQKILSILPSKENEGIEILSRVGNDQRSPDYYFSLVDKNIKIEFDYHILRQVFDLYGLGKLNYDMIHININPATLTEENFIKKLYKIFQDYNFGDFHKLSFEILENGNVRGIDILNENIDILRTKGIQIGLDDYPNENNNNELLCLINELDFVKIDKSFILSLGHTNPEIVKNIIQKLIYDIHIFHPGVKIVIEGVENLECYNFLLNNIKGIDFVQGYFFGKPEKVI